jgi:hypothetical protein
MVSLQVRPAAHGLHPLPLLLPVAESSPDGSREISVQPMSRDTLARPQRVLPARQQARQASRHEHHCFTNKAYDTTSSKPVLSMPAAHPTTIYPTVAGLCLNLWYAKSPTQLDSDGGEESESLPGDLDFQMLHSLGTYTHLLQQLKHLAVRLPRRIFPSATALCS